MATSTHVNMGITTRLKTSFLASVPTWIVTWESLMDGYNWSDLDVDTQVQLLHSTVKHPLCQRFPTSISYRKSFLKYIFKKLEESGVEVCDELYETFSDLLSETQETDMAYKIYTLPSGSHIVLEESVNIVSKGTTGLNTWQAAQYLAEWAIENADLIKNKSIIELGSGIGFTGLAIRKECNPKRYTFSDCHSEVLKLLAKNISNNLCNDCQHASYIQRFTKSPPDGAAVSTEVTQCTEEISEVSVTERNNIKHDKSDAYDDTLDFSCHWNEDVHSSEYFTSWTLASVSSLSVARIDWEQVVESEVADLEADIILAADVVYDSSIIPSLVRVLKILLRKATSNPRMAIIASTVRNRQTRDEFLTALDNNQIQHELVNGPRMETFYYDRTTPIEVLRLTL